MKILDSYKTIAEPTDEILYKEKNSKFIGYAYPITTEADVKPILENLRKIHFNAVHHCYAFQIGVEPVYYRVNDNGEPGNTAGMPIYGQIQSFELTNVLVVIVRYFGGTKLGVSGLITAYKTAAQLSLESATIIEKTINIHYILNFNYKHLNKVMQISKEKCLTIINQKMELTCEIEIAIRKKNAEMVFDIFNSIFGIEIKLKE